MENKILVIGSPGSGKSYFSKKLSKLTNIPVYHMDLLYWHENWVSTPRDEFDKIINEILNKDEWILDGNYNRTLENRVKFAQIVYFLDLDPEICLIAEKERRNKKRDDFPSFLNEGEDPSFVQYIKDFPIINKPLILEILKKYPHVKLIIFKTREEINEFLKSLES